MKSNDPWLPNVATDKLRAIARDPKFTIAYKLHAKERLAERNLIASDVLYALKYGFVYEQAIPATRQGFFRYRVECKTPNSGSRAIGVVVIPNHVGCYMKIVTVMWIDEFERRDGSIIGE
ncbi:DUF4258 domain-containing protein [Agrobacterium fabrum]|uniref:DUF4258 domain-containing protein n=1 Tax=Agrobacterium fabrum (strain C58 / ATCC 33970) TaxID=176299 RepID=Q8UI34_AGRFC|nr:DUF4258 domain-containing protein [Agrobacterium fabrum]CAD0207398.1 hypothetical protein AGTUEHA105_LOCUS153 [Agrobacterium tumefaciens]AAL41485.1 hypothetical protein Atu0466 [Agrobacterium fabrum str. C58]MCX2877381.1 DUF4258 domain-containing protein [Agrobacterium fabrum]NMV68841.1 DUF4258 domain-containing protein [Agrobacterium fabrum]QQN05869.1 DUF4258 domain-containing protein [Agrobacterium fabrum]